VNHEDQAPVTPAALQRSVWDLTISEAATEHDVIELTLYFISTWTPQELARLPLDCRPGRIRDADDVGSLAVSLSRAVMSASTQDAPYVQRMAGFFAQASERLSQLLRAPSEEV
jgi:hypothetical protein